MGQVLSIGLADHLVDALRHELAASGEADLVETRSLGSIGQEVDAVVIGYGGDPVRLAQGAQSQAPSVPVIIAVPPAQLALCQRTLLFTPMVSHRVRCVTSADADTLARSVVAAAHEHRAGQQTRRTLAVMNERLAAMPGRLPDPASEVLGKLLENAPIGVLLLDQDGEIRAANVEAAAMLDQRAEGSFAAHLEPTELDRWRRLLAEVAGGDPGRATVRLIGGAPILEAILTTLDQQSNANTYLLILHDVTRRVQLVEELEESNRRKDDFLAMLGHELRNPLAPIVTAVELMRLRGAGENQRELEVIARQSRHLTSLLDDLLDVARITRGRIDLQLADIELAEPIAAAIEQVQDIIQKNRHQLELTVPPAGLLVHGDPNRLAQVVANLVSNAARHTLEGGTIAVSASRRDRQVVLEVRDSGPGIAPALLPHIFELFVQGSQHLDRKAGGLGVGLGIVASLVELHGGTVEVASEPGRGSTFIVRLPAAPDRT